MAHPDTPDEAQVEVLDWIAGGCQPGVYEGHGHRVSAAALKRHGLVEVRGRGSTWHAGVTDAGQRYLDTVDSPTPPSARRGNVSVTPQLVDDVIAAGGSASFPRRRHGRPGEIDYGRRAALARLHGKVPAGHQLVDTISGDAFQISIVVMDAQVVDVPEKIRRLHPIARSYRDDTKRHEVSRGELHRATRIVHAPTVEAERRGYEVRLAQPENQGVRRSRWRGPEHGHLEIIANGYEARLRVSEVGLSSRAFLDHSNGRYVRTTDGSYEQRTRTVSDYEANATGRLSLELIGYAGRSGRRAKWADRTRSRLEDDLGEALGDRGPSRRWAQSPQRGGNGD